MNLEQLKQEEEILLNLLSENRSNQKELNRIEYVKQWGVDIGDTVEWLDGKITRTGVISKIEYSGVKPNYYWALLFNSNGKVGKREMRIWSWNLKEIKLIAKSSQACG